MFVDFNKVFFPTEEKKEANEMALVKLLDEEKQFWISSGLNEKECMALEELERDEQWKLHPYEAYSNRYSLIKCNIISVEQVRSDIEEWINR